MLARLAYITPTIITQQSRQDRHYQQYMFYLLNAAASMCIIVVVVVVVAIVTIIIVVISLRSIIINIKSIFSQKHEIALNHQNALFAGGAFFGEREFHFMEIHYETIYV